MKIVVLVTQHLLLLTLLHAWAQSTTPNFVFGPPCQQGAFALPDTLVSWTCGIQMTGRYACAGGALRFPSSLADGSCAHHLQDLLPATYPHMLPLLTPSEQGTVQHSTVQWWCAPCLFCKTLIRGLGLSCTWPTQLLLWDSWLGLAAQNCRTQHVSSSSLGRLPMHSARSQSVKCCLSGVSRLNRLQHGGTHRCGLPACASGPSSNGGRRVQLQPGGQQGGHAAGPGHQHAPGHAACLRRQPRWIRHRHQRLGERLALDTMENSPGFASYGACIPDLSPEIPAGGPRRLWQDINLIMLCHGQYAPADQLFKSKARWRTVPMVW